MIPDYPHVPYCCGFEQKCQPNCSINHIRGVVDGLVLVAVGNKTAGQFESPLGVEVTI